MNFNNFWSIVQYAKVFQMPNYRVIQIQDMIFWMATIPDILILIQIYPKYMYLLGVQIQNMKMDFKISTLGIMLGNEYHHHQDGRLILKTISIFLI